MATYDERPPNMHIDFKVTPWSWCFTHERPERVDWTAMDCDRAGFYRTERGALSDHRQAEEDLKAMTDGVPRARTVHSPETYEMDLAEAGPFEEEPITERRRGYR